MSDKDAPTQDAAAPAANDQQLMPRPAAAVGIRRDDTMAQAFQGLLPSSVGEAMVLSTHLARSEAMPHSLKGKPEAVFTVIMAGMEIGLTPIRAIQSIAIISGTLAFKADLQLAQVRRSGSLDFYDEGYERANVTDGDGNLERRLAKLPDEAQKILDLTDDVPDGKPYGWAICRRKGEQQYHVRVFTWHDAEQFKYSEWNDNQKTQKKLSEKAAYVNNPQDMYPKRARVRVLQVTHSDVLAGMPAIEAMDDVAIDGHVISSEPVQPTSSEDTIAALLADIAAKDATLAKTIAAGFDQLQMGIGKRLQKLRQHAADPAALMEWLRTEYANQATHGKGRVAKDVLGAKGPELVPDAPKPAAPEPAKAAAPAKAEPAKVAPLMEQAQRAADIVADQASQAEFQQAVETVKAAPASGAERMKSIAERFKAAGKTF